MRPPLPTTRLPAIAPPHAPRPWPTRHTQPPTPGRRSPWCGATPSNTSPPPDRSRYHAFELDGCEFLVARSPDGVLDVADTYVLDEQAGVYSRPAGDAPSSLPPPGVYAAVPWEEKFRGDTLYREPAWSKTLRIYLVRALDGDGDAAAANTLDLKTVVALDAEKRSVRRAPVEDRTTSQDPNRVTLRIR